MTDAPRRSLKTRKPTSLSEIIVARSAAPGYFGHGSNVDECYMKKAVHFVEEFSYFVVEVAHTLQTRLQSFVIPILRALHERSGAFRRWKRRRFEPRFGRALEFGWICHVGSR